MRNNDIPKLKNMVKPLILLALAIFFFEAKGIAQATDAQRQATQRFFEEGQRQREEELNERKKQEARNREIDRINDSIKTVEAAMYRQNQIDDSIEYEREKELRVIEEKKWDQQQKSAAAAQAKRKAEREKQILATYGEKTGRMILAKQVQIGWSKKLCIESWGKPSKVNTTINAYGTEEQWVYSLSRYLYFHGDKLYTIQK